MICSSLKLRCDSESGNVPVNVYLTPSTWHTWSPNTCIHIDSLHCLDSPIPFAVSRDCVEVRTQSTTGVIHSWFQHLWPVSPGIRLYVIYPSRIKKLRQLFATHAEEDFDLERSKRKAPHIGCIRFCELLLRILHLTPIGKNGVACKALSIKLLHHQMVNVYSNLKEAPTKVLWDERVCFSCESVKCTYIVWTTEENRLRVYRYSCHYTANRCIIEPLADLLELLLFKTSQEMYVYHSNAIAYHESLA